MFFSAAGVDWTAALKGKLVPPVRELTLEEEEEEPFLKTQSYKKRQQIQQRKWTKLAPFANKRLDALIPLGSSAPALPSPKPSRVDQILSGQTPWGSSSPVSKTQSLCTRGEQMHRGLVKNPRKIDFKVRAWYYEWCLFYCG